MSGGRRSVPISAIDASARDIEDDFAYAPLLNRNYIKPFSCFKCMMSPVDAADPTKCEPYAKLILTVLAAAELDSSANEMLDTMDPYVEILLDDQHKEKTDTMLATCAPTWSATYNISVYNPKSILTLKVWDSDFAGDDFIGFVDIKIGRLPLGVDVEDWFQLYGVDDDQYADNITCRLKTCSQLQQPKHAGWIHLRFKIDVRRETDVFFAYMLYPPDHGKGLKPLRLEHMNMAGQRLGKLWRRFKAETEPLANLWRRYPTFICSAAIIAMWMQFFIPFCFFAVAFAGLYTDRVSHDTKPDEFKHDFKDEQTVANNFTSVKRVSTVKSKHQSIAAAISDHLGRGKKNEESPAEIQMTMLQMLNKLLPPGPSKGLRWMQKFMDDMEKCAGSVVDRVKHSFKTISLPIMALLLILHFALPYFILLCKIVATLGLVMCTIIGRVISAVSQFYSNRRHLTSKEDIDTEVLRAETYHSTRSGGSPILAKRGHHLSKTLKADLLAVSAYAAAESEAYEDHSLQKLSFHSLTWCRMCAGVVIGFTGNGYECSKCKLVICSDKKCRDLVKELRDCSGKKQPSPFLCNPHHECWNQHEMVV